MSLESVAAGEDRLDTLRELRAYLAKALDDTDSARDQASLSARLMDVLVQIDELVADRGDQDDEFGSLLSFPGAG